jgi:signal transduction histidine kinase
MGFMKVRPSLGLLYGILVLLIIAQGTWWVIYQIGEGRRYEQLQLQRLEAERLSAEALQHEQGVREPAVRIDPKALESAHREAQRRSRMFLWEGIFFLGLLAAGVFILGIAHRAESRFRRAREIFLAGVTHEFRTPLAALRLHAETLGRPSLGAAAKEAILPKLIAEVERMETLIDQVLEAGRDQELDAPLEVLDAAEEARRVLGEMSGYLELEGAQLETKLQTGIKFLGRRAAFATAFRNLVQNAATHSARPVRITVELAAAADIRLSVQDTGPGIAKEHHRRIFESFERVDGGDHSRTRGSGLGLYLARRNLESMEGRIELSSQPGRGSTFTIVLPRKNEAPREDL